MDWNKLLSTERIRKSIPTDIRNEFESDFGRIIYSPALRRMHDKTQVFPLTSDDNIHSRLTHSNEVMSLGYTFGIKLAESKKFQKTTKKEEKELLRIIPILLQNACLVHDIGNSPFGHFGETIISNYFQNLNDEKKEPFASLKTDHEKNDFLNYDGNAQGFRVLTKLQILNDPFGLNLTYATLATTLKYPNHGEINNVKKAKLEDRGEILDFEPIESKKHGIFHSEIDIYNDIIEKTGLRFKKRVLRHPLCYLMEAADSIAYLCMDMEDGFNKGIFSIKDIKTKFEERIKESFINSESSNICKDVIEIINNINVNDSYKIVNIRIALIRHFVNLAFNNFEKNLEEIEKGEYNFELIQDDEDKLFKLVESFSKLIFNSREINNLESTGYSVIVGLLNFYIDFIFNKKNKKFINKAKVLISESIISAAIEETLIETCQNKLDKRKDSLSTKFNKFNTVGNQNYKLDKELEEISSKNQKFKSLKTEYQRLLNLSKTKVVEKKSPEYSKLLEVRKEIYDLIEPDFDDLSDYYKLRVIVDFISGMTDNYALKHFQKISGQRIN